MKRFDNPERRADIQTAYANRMKRSRLTLDVLKLWEQRYRSLDASIPESGSDLRRALHAYSFSVLNTINDNKSATFCPIVMDSPKQRDPGTANWLRILNCIQDDQPAESHLILSFVDDAGVSFGGEIIGLREKRSMLTKDQFSEVEAELLSLIERSDAAASSE